MKPLWMKKISALCILLLLLQMALYPSSSMSIVSGNPAQGNDIITVTTQVCSNTDNKFYEVLLSRQQVDGIKTVFDDLQMRLSQAGSLKETRVIFSEVIDSLYRHGLFSNSLSAEQVKLIVIGALQNQQLFTHLYRNFQKSFSEGEIRNSFCLLAGNSSTTHFATLAKRITLRLYDIVDYGTGTALLRKAALALWLVFKEISTIRQSILYRDGAHLGVAISYGNYHYAPYPDWFSPAEGWLWTLGLNGRQNISGAFWGQKITSGWQPEDDWFMNYTWRGCLGFTGLITYLGRDRAYYLGSALHVNVGPNRP